MIAITVCFDCQSGVLQFKNHDGCDLATCCVCFIDIVHVSEMGMGFITIWFHYNSNVKLIRGMESGTILKELVSVFVLKN
jgi:hypothetical protein